MGYNVTQYLARRAIHSIFVVLGVSLAVFVVARLSGDPVLLMVQPGTSMADIDAMRHRLGMDAPLAQQYLNFVLGAMHGDLGDSIWQSQPVTTLVFERLPATVELTIASLVFSLVLAMPAGIISATRRNSPLDRAVMIFALLGQSVPVFWLGLILIMVFSVQLDWLPSSGYGTLGHLVLPTITLGLFSVARTARLVRSGLLDVLGQDYVRTARSKGLPERMVLIRHALRNTLIPVVTLVGLDFGRLLGGAVITETIFGWPGVGRLAVDAIFRRDFPLLQGIVFTIAVVFVIVNLLTDLAYTALDPRVRLR